jgi:drug/metabolite transporter (DMT)-like permease
MVLFGIWAKTTGTLAVPTAAPAIIAIVWLTIFSTFVAYSVFWALLKKMSATRVAALVYLEPPVTLLWSSAMFGYELRLSTVFGLAIVLIGLFLDRGGQGEPSARQPRTSASVAKA